MKRLKSELETLYDKFIKSKGEEKDTVEKLLRGKLLENFKKRIDENKK